MLSVLSDIELIGNAAGFQAFYESRGLGRQGLGELLNDANLAEQGRILNRSNGEAMIFLAFKERRW